MNRSRRQAPAKIEAGARTYSLAEDWIALPAVTGTALPAGTRYVLEEEQLAVVPATASARATDGAGPVYRLEPGGTPAVPTGRVFLQLTEGESAAALATEFAKAGYRIEDVPAWAPHTAWLRPVSGEVLAGLAGLGSVKSIPGVRQVEPQLLRPRALK